MTESDLVFILDDEAQPYWALDTSWCQDDLNPDWVALSVLCVGSLVELGALLFG